MTTQQAKVGLRDFSMLIALVLISVVFSIMDPAFVSARNLSQLAIELSATAVLSLGMLLIIVPGHIDLSVGSGLGLVGGLAAVLITGHGPRRRWRCWCPRWSAWRSTRPWAP